MPSPSQGPYGPPNPYSGQPPQAPYGPPVAQQPPPPYGTVPYPRQQPYGYHQQQPYGWGAPPTAPLPGRNRNAKTVGIIGVAVAVVLVILAVLGRSASGLLSSGFPKAEYTLSLPKTLVDGRYELTRDRSDTDGRKYAEQANRAWDARDVKGVFGEYTLGGDETKGTLVVTGMYGRFKYPDATRKEMMKGAGDGDSRIAVPARDFHPDGADGITITCEVAVGSGTGQEVTVPTCGWTDGNTLGSVAQATPDALTKDPSDVDLDELATATAHIRSEMRKPIG